MRAAHSQRLLVALATATRRDCTARELAQALGAQELLLLVRDPEIRTLVPAQGFPRTLRGGATWRDFLRACPEEGRHAAEVELPAGTRRNALAVCRDEVALVLLDAGAELPNLGEIEDLLPLLSALLRSDQQRALAEAEATAAREMAQRAQQLATALESARAETARLNAELREEHRRKDEFLAMLGHELRNPLAPLVMSIELLRAGRLDERQQVKQLDVMGRQVQHLARLVDDLLDVSRVSRGRVRLTRERLALERVLEDAVEDARPLIERRGHALTVDCADSGLYVDGDPVRLVQVFSNLVNNAAKYTEPGGHLQIHVARAEDQVVVTVVDDGIGIAADMLPRVFDLFAQAASTLDRSEGGLGIGLTLARVLVEMHGGTLSARSKGVGEGSTFEVRLPLADPPAAEPAAEDVKAGTHARRVLVVDDNADAAAALALLIELFGHHCETALDGPSALALSTSGAFDLFLLDIGLPQMDGYELARRLRETLGERAKLIALTGYADEDTSARIRTAGFHKHVVKPISAEALQALLAEA